MLNILQEEKENRRLAKLAKSKIVSKDSSEKSLWSRLYGKLMSRKPFRN